MRRDDKALHKRILGFLKSEEHPQTTRAIALHLGQPWHTTLTLLLRLQIDGKVSVFKAGIAELWSIKK